MSNSSEECEFDNFHFVNYKDIMSMKLSHKKHIKFFMEAMQILFSHSNGVKILRGHVHGWLENIKLRDPILLPCNDSQFFPFPGLLGRE